MWWGSFLTEVLKSIHLLKKMPLAELTLAACQLQITFFSLTFSSWWFPIAASMTSVPVTCCGGKGYSSIFTVIEMMPREVIAVVGPFIFLSAIGKPDCLHMCSIFCRSVSHSADEGFPTIRNSVNDI